MIAFRRRYAQALSCVTNAHVDVGGGYTPATSPHALILAAGEPVPLRGPGALALSVGHHYVVVEQAENAWHVLDAAYFYALERAGGGELVAYHWHPRGSSSVTAPHVHVRADVKVGQRLLPKLHLPTGVIRLQDLLRLAIVELDVEPLRDDWELILNQTLDP